MRARYYSPQMRRFVNADILHGQISDSPSLNRYSYVNGNPVSFVDPFGLAPERGITPTPLEAAYMADHIYKAEIVPGKIVKSYGDWVLEDIHENKQGLKIGIYYKTINGVKSYALVNAGSKFDFKNELVDTCYDWFNNFAQPYGYSIDMIDSISYAKSFVNDHPTAHITFVGHSKGGGEAIANAVATGYNAITFNPATPRLSEYGLTMDGYKGEITNYIVEGEILHTVLTGLADSANPLILLSTLGMISSSFVDSLLVKMKLFEFSLNLKTIAKGFFLDPVGEVITLPYVGDKDAVDRHLMDCVIPEVKKL